MHTGTEASVCATPDVAPLLEASIRSSPCASDGVTLMVTPRLKVPVKRLPTLPYQQCLIKLANKESSIKGLIDSGGMAHMGDATFLANGHYHGFISATTAAFANHYPLSLRPQHFWCPILQGVAKHVEKNSESVQKKWVAHEGKKKLIVRRDAFRMGQTNDWAGVVHGHADSFGAQIDANTVEGVAQDLSPTFSGTTAVEMVCAKVTLMDICKSFFSYKCMTCCGFPSITLEGTEEDWMALRANAETLLSKRCEHGWAQEWMTALLPLLDKILDEYRTGLRGHAGDEPFWNSMCKRGGTQGSGARTWFNGWVNILFPYILDHPNQYCVPYSPSNEYVKEGRDGGLYGMGAPRGVQGPDCSDFPSGVAEAPVTWQYFEEENKLKFAAGFVGATQDASDGTIRPALAWYIAHAGAEQSVMHDPYAKALGVARGAAGRPLGPPPRSGFSRWARAAVDRPSARALRHAVPRVRPTPRR